MLRIASLIVTKNVTFGRVNCNTMYVYQHSDWPKWHWDSHRVSNKLTKIVEQQGRLLGRLGALGLDASQHTAFESNTQEVTGSFEIEGEQLNRDEVRSSLANHLGVQFNQPVHVSDKVASAVHVFIDATNNYSQPLTHERLFNWHASLFPTGLSGGLKIETGKYRSSAQPMQIVSGPIGHEKVHYEAPAAGKLKTMMVKLLHYINSEQEDHAIIKAAVAHLWFEIIHPFDDGNGRIGRSLIDYLFCHADQESTRYYNVSWALLEHRKAYYELLNKAGEGDLDITEWVLWFFDRVEQALDRSQQIANQVELRTKFWMKFGRHPFNQRQVKVLTKLLGDFEGNVTSSKWSRMTSCTRMTATRDINELLDLGILQRSGSGGRSTSYTLAFDWRDKG